MLIPLGQGNHNNIHFEFFVGSKKKRVLKIKLVGFFDTEEAYITMTKSMCDIKWFNIDMIFDKLKSDLEEKGFILKSRSENDLLLPYISSEELLKVI